MPVTRTFRNRFENLGIVRPNDSEIQSSLPSAGEESKKLNGTEESTKSIITAKFEIVKKWLKLLRR